jgi:lysophospholipase L1-like esterase
VGTLVLAGRRTFRQAPGGRRVAALGGSHTEAGVYGRRLAELLRVPVRSHGFRGKTTRIIAGHLPEALAGGTTDLVVLAAVNDVAAGRTATQITTDLHALFARAKATGVRLVAVRLPPAAGHARFVRRGEVVAAVNAWISDQKGRPDGPDEVVDPAALGDAAGRLAPAFDSGDHLHMNRAGYRRLGEIIRAQAFA